MPALDDNRNPQLAGRERCPRRRKEALGMLVRLDPRTNELGGRVACGVGRVVARQRTTTVSSIHGWIAQMNRCVPGVSVLGPIVIWPPAGMKLVG